MTAWLNTYLTGGVYLTAAAMATVLLVVLWFTRTRMSMAMCVCASLALAMWAGLALHIDWGVEEPRTLLLTASVFAGCLLVLMVWPVLRQSQRGNKQIKQARACVGKVGRVYRAIDTDEPGVVEVTQGEKTMRLPAICETGSSLPAFCEVEVMKTTDAGVLIVAMVK